MEKVNLAGKLATFSEYFSPRIVAELNGRPGSQPWHVKLVRFKGEFVWHHHDHEDELFYVVRGWFDMQLRDRTITVKEGEFLVVPQGTEHRPVAPEEVEILLFEPATTLNTGNVENEMTVREPQKI